MRDHNQDTPTLAHSLDRLGEGLIALSIEVRVGLIEHDQERIAVEGSCQSQPLALTG